MDFLTLRENMVSEQIIKRGIKDERLLAAMRKVPRHLFVDDEIRHMAYDDMALRIGEGQTISQPYMVAIMSELLELTGGERVLEIGTGSGYQTAVLAELAGEVYTIEYHPLLSAEAKGRLIGMGYPNVRFMAGDGTLGWPEEAPFERIMITAGAPCIPTPLREQIGEGGIIVAPVGGRISQTLIDVRKVQGVLREKSGIPCMFVPLVGRHGWDK